VSSRHAELTLDGVRLFVRDLDSKNGTFVNRERIEGETEVQAGDVLHIGREELRVLSEELSLDGGQTMIIESSADLPNRLVIGTRQFQQLMETRAVEPYFQPLVELPGGQLHAYEALGRGTLPGLSPSPYELFRLAAAVEQEPDLSRLLRDVAAEVGRQLPGPPRIFMNTHPREMETGGLTDSLTRLRSAAPDLPVTIEIHEAAVADTAHMADFRQQLTDLDMELAYDDFGAGQARLVELVEVPPDMLKFDIGLIRQLDTAPETKQKMVGTLVAMATDLGIPCLAEGVERREEAGLCTDLGFSYAQGYLFGKPAPRSALGTDPAVC
jgi:EAL domain-containing protein (putative c-di-GMP-specific phosphodiesterase class I)